MKAYLKDVLEFAATVFCAIATNAIILFVVYLICGTLESGAAALLFFILGCFVFPFESRILDFLEERKHEKNESDLIRKKLKEAIRKMTPYQQDLMLVAVEKMKENRIAKLDPH